MYAGRFGDLPLKILASKTGLREWVDYLPVKGETGGRSRSYDNQGYLVSTSQSLNPSGTAWTNFIPVYVEAGRTRPWSTDADGYIPFNDVVV